MPTKEEVLKVIEKGIVHLYDIKRELAISKKNLVPILEVLVEEGVLFHSKNSLIYGKIKTGTIILKKDGYGFISVEGEEADYYVSKTELAGIYDGDEVLFYPVDEKNRLISAKIIQVVKRGHTFIIGYFKQIQKKNKTVSYIISSNPNFSIRAIVKEKNSFTNGTIVWANIRYVGTAIEAYELKEIGYKDDPGIEISQIALEYGFHKEFPMEVQKEIASIKDFVSQDEEEGRRDFTNRLIFTIDGNDSKDFDDAVSLSKNEDGSYELGVYIADVAHYVLENTALDKEALKRGTSVYLADRVIPMLPRKLSNGICSLNEGEKRLVLACLMTIAENGNLINYEIVEGVIRSKHRLTYEEVNLILEEDSQTKKKFIDILPTIIEMEKLSHILREKRNKKGAITFDVREYKFKLDEKGKPLTICPVERKRAEEMIEDFMLMANETVAYHTYIMQVPSIYRIHEKPEMEKLVEVFLELERNGVVIPSYAKKIQPKHIQMLLEEVESNPLKELFNGMLLRSMMKAKYSENCLGHYALAMQYYCHFTSPIRRYPDLMVHRIIKRLLLHPQKYEEELSHFQGLASLVAESTSKTERLGIECERSVNDMLYAWYMEDRIKKVYRGKISSITSFGIFVELEGGIEGMVALDNLFGYYDYDSFLKCYTNGKITYRLGDEVEIIVLSSSKETRKIDFMFTRDYELFKRSGNNEGGLFE